jgi:hypothetical protein
VNQANLRVSARPSSNTILFSFPRAKQQKTLMGRKIGRWTSKREGGTNTEKLIDRRKQFLPE